MNESEGEVNLRIFGGKSKDEVKDRLAEKSEDAITVSDVTKVYRLYARQRDRLWESLGLDR